MEIWGGTWGFGCGPLTVEEGDQQDGEERWQARTTEGPRISFLGLL